ncbi:uncharacterized protein Z518_10256 [Rhinocladiella mackenziei CBS 650.93]|uniref:MutL C-terminal dimerisation domain-containing protein n=1 Tax=Rhinocladiella mackenziei CBS 650.93 TaxID=1442369 RepID=A0A0D2I2X3_9EURO|nr:uncharacterized protein Z518_10256 [Rhinocladiella mackenziei CBS 650.93]KIX00119.1 hypothetical protein Z518_10256 [Rhinocladiella mackenziei CBS 650.93]
MAATSVPIILLPADVRSKVSSSYEIASPQHVIEGLFQNALDAEATSINIEVDFTKGSILVCDDGIGIREGEFAENGHLAQLHCTSKFNSSHPVYGRYGRFLSNLSFLSVLSISSQHESESHASRSILHRGEVISRQLRVRKEDVGLGQKGTSVVVQNLFGDIPVRAKFLSIRYSSPSQVEKDFDQVKRTLVAYVLARSTATDVRFSLKSGRRQYVHCHPPGPANGQVCVESVVATLFQAKFISALDTATWRLASVYTGEYSIHAAFSLQPSPCRAIQFISIGHIPLLRERGKNYLFETVNHVFEYSNFGCLVETPGSTRSMTNTKEDRGLSREFVRSGKGVDRWPMFYIRIDPKSVQPPGIVEQDTPSAELHHMIDHLKTALESLVSHFLDSYGFQRVPKHIRGKKGRVENLSTDQFSSWEPSRQPASERSQIVSEARFFNSGNRFQSGRHHHDKDTTNETRLNPPNDELQPEGQAETAGRTHLLASSLGVDEDETEGVDRSHPCERAAQNEDQDRQCNENADTNALLWTNPLKDQEILVRPRTGAIISNDERNLSLTPRREKVRQSDLQPLKISSLRDFEGSIAQHPVNLREYDNLLPRQPESPIPSLISTETVMATVQRWRIGDSSISSGQKQNVSKKSLACATVLGQVDQKFILATVPSPIDCTKEYEQSHLLILIDQHAADERIKFERLCQEFCKSHSVQLSKPLVFEVDQVEAKLFEERKAYFRRWCFTYTINRKCRDSPSTCSQDQNPSVSVTTLPTLLAERCRVEPKLLVDLMRSEAWSDHANRPGVSPRPSDQDSARQNGSWMTSMAHCPAGALEILKSRSCRTSIMFNDNLDADQCGQLVQRLSQCTFPFQCAHGRPTLTVLVGIGSVDDLGTVPGLHSAEPGFDVAWKSWPGSA